MPAKSTRQGIAPLSAKGHKREACGEKGGADIRREIEFKTGDGVMLRGWHYLPDERNGRVPAVIMAHAARAAMREQLENCPEVGGRFGGRPR